MVRARAGIFRGERARVLSVDRRTKTAMLLPVDNPSSLKFRLDLKELEVLERA